MTIDPTNPFDFPTKRPDRPIRFTFVCKNPSCKHFWTRELIKRHDRWHFGKFYQIPVYRIIDSLPQPKQICPKCGGNNVRGTEIHGRINDTPCDRRCTGAHGHDCECSCGGANHGKDHQI